MAFDIAPSRPILRILAGSGTIELQHYPERILGKETFDISTYNQGSSNISGLIEYYTSQLKLEIRVLSNDHSLYRYILGVRNPFIGLYYTQHKAGHSFSADALEVSRGFELKL